MRDFSKSRHTRDEFFNGQHRFEHWYLDNCVYFLTARCRNKIRCFESEAAKQVFWDRFDFYAREYGFTPWVTTLLDNHYHTIGYLHFGKNLGPMMQRIHGSVAKLVNDLTIERLTPFWYETGRQGYFDGCIRDEIQATRAFRYILRQAERAGIVGDWKEYAHTHVNVELTQALKRAKELRAFLEGVPYARYEGRNPRR